jgi:hypothetical protein
MRLYALRITSSLGLSGSICGDFRQVSDKEVIETLKRFLPKPKEGKTQLPAG